MRGVGWLLVVALWQVPGPAYGQRAADVLLRQRGEAFAAAMRSQGDALSAFARDHLSSSVGAEGRTAAFADAMRQAISELGRVGRSIVQVPRPTLVFVYLEHAGGGWQNYQFRVATADGHRLQLVFRAVAVEPIERPAAGLGSDEAARYLERLQAQLASEQPFSGVAVVRRGGKDVVAIAQGQADAAAKVPVTRGSRFGMASGSKMFTAVAILQLAQKGKLALTDPLARHLPDFPNQAFAKRATLHQLLTHTAAAGDYWDPAYERAWDAITSVKQMLPFVLAHLDETPPGVFRYSNSGFILLGLVVEAVSGASFYDYVRTQILEPAGMTSTGFPVRGDGTPGLAQAYLPKFDAGALEPGVYLPAVLGARGSSAGGATTTADDLLRFAAALRAGTLLDRTHLELLTAAHAPSGADGAYGYGTQIDTSRGVLSYGHGGRAPGTHFDLRIYPALDTVLIVMSNYDTIAGPELSSALDHLIRNTPRRR